MDTFIFNNQSDAKAAHRAELPTGLHSKAALLDALSIALRFPDYFGRNWDSLEECIRDLTWLPDGDVILSHQDVPLSEDKALLSAYLTILKGAVQKWSRAGKRRLLVMFPSHTEYRVQSALRSDS